jgi:hypothetical protein
MHGLSNKVSNAWMQAVKPQWVAILTMQEHERNIESAYGLHPAAKAMFQAAVKNVW